MQRINWTRITDIDDVERCTVHMVGLLPTKNMDKYTHDLAITFASLQEDDDGSVWWNLPNEIDAEHMEDGEYRVVYIADVSFYSGAIHTDVVNQLDADTNVLTDWAEADLLAAPAVALEPDC